MNTLAKLFLAGGGILAYALLPLALPSCSTTQQQKAAAVIASPAAQAVLAAVEQAAFNAAIAAASSAATQYASTGTVKGNDLKSAAIIGGIDGAAASMRTLQATHAAAQGAALQASVAQGSGNSVVASQVAPAVAAAVSGAASQVPADDANEAAARGLDKAAAALGGQGTIGPMGRIGRMGPRLLALSPGIEINKGHTGATGRPEYIVWVKGKGDF